MNTDTVPTIDDPTFELIAETIADLMFTFINPEYSPEDRDRFVAAFERLQDGLGKEMPLCVWQIIVGMRLERPPTAEECAALELPEFLEDPASEATFQRVVFERADVVYGGEEQRTGC